MDKRVLESLKEEFKKQVAGKFEVSNYKVIKNNGLVLYGLQICKPGVQIGPIIYDSLICDMFTKHSQDVCSTLRALETFVDEAIDTPYISKGLSLDYSLYDEVRDKIYFSLVNGENNEEYLEGKVTVDFLDLKVLFRVLVAKNEEGVSSIVVTQEMFSTWDITIEQLFNDALNNAKNINPLVSKPMVEILKTHLTEDEIAVVEKSDNESIPLYVFSNNTMLNGASVVLYPEFREAVQNLGYSEVYALPSSIHEMIILPTNVESDYLHEMAHNVNSSVVPFEEQLSENVYLYDAENDEWRVVY